ncbi:MAG: hypothetical protein WAT58_08265 [Candidatus Dormiibacterota bacterium]
MQETHRVKRALDKMSHTRGAEAGDKPKAEKGRAQEFPHHEHLELTHVHGHSHVTHYREPGERDEWSHLTTTHEHEHNHPRLTHMHVPHEELQLEHVHEAHHHDHGESPGH